jgi:hypothetical protein
MGRPRSADRRPPTQPAHRMGFGVTQNATQTLMYDRVAESGYGAVSAVWNLAYDGGMGLGAAVARRGRDEAWPQRANARHRSTHRGPFGIMPLNLRRIGRDRLHMRVVPSRAVTYCGVAIT